MKAKIHEENGIFCSTCDFFDANVSAGGILLSPYTESCQRYGTHINSGAASGVKLPSGVIL